MLLLIARWLWLKLRWRGRLRTDGLCFVCPGVKFEIGRDATVSLGRWSWIGHGCKVRVHEGELSIGAKSVLGQECTVSAYQHISIGRECIIADRVMMIDFDHGMVEVERPIREQGIYKRDVNIGHNVWIGYGRASAWCVGWRQRRGRIGAVVTETSRQRRRGWGPGRSDPDAQGPNLPLAMAGSKSEPGRFLEPAPLRPACRRRRRHRRTHRRTPARNVIHRVRLTPLVPVGADRRDPGGRHSARASATARAAAIVTPVPGRRCDMCGPCLPMQLPVFGCTRRLPLRRSPSPLGRASAQQVACVDELRWRRGSQPGDAGRRASVGRIRRDVCAPDPSRARSAAPRARGACERGTGRAPRRLSNVLRHNSVNSPTPVLA